MPPLTEPERDVICAVVYLVLWVVFALAAAWVDRRERGARRQPSEPPRDTLVDVLPGHEAHDDDTLVSSTTSNAPEYVSAVPTPPIAEDIELERCVDCNELAPTAHDGRCWNCSMSREAGVA